MGVPWFLVNYTKKQYYVGYKLVELGIIGVYRQFIKNLWSESDDIKDISWFDDELEQHENFQNIDTSI